MSEQNVPESWTDNQKIMLECLNQAAQVWETWKGVRTMNEIPAEIRAHSIAVLAAAMFRSNQGRKNSGGRSASLRPFGRD